MDKTSDEIRDYLSKIQRTVHTKTSALINFKIVLSQAGIFTFGCHYRNVEVMFMSMYGSVTDAQIFSKELSDQEMIDITTCR